MMNSRHVFFAATVVGLLLAGSGELCAETAFKTVNYRFNIESEFYVRSAAADGRRYVNFGDIDPTQGQPIKTMHINIYTNTTNRYHIYHTWNGKMLNVQGGQVPESGMLYRVSKGQKGGRSMVPDFEVIPEDKSFIFTSVSDGGSDTFDIDYTLVFGDLMPPGHYYGNIKIHATNVD